MTQHNPWVQIIGGPKAAPFGYLEIGARFHHPNFPDDIMVKTSKRSYKDARGHRWTGSAGQAVVPVKDEPRGGKARHAGSGRLERSYLRPFATYCSSCHAHLGGTAHAWKVKGSDSYVCNACGGATGGGKKRHAQSMATSKDFDTSTLKGMKAAERYKSRLNEQYDKVEVMTTGWNKVRIIGRNSTGAPMGGGKKRHGIGKLAAEVGRLLKD